MTTVELPLGVYVHLPWCVRKCPYCDFNSHRGGDASQRSAYLEALSKDIAASAELVGDRPVDSVFLGGGTPSLFAADEIGFILETLALRLNVAGDAEITMEANPGALERDRLRGYRVAGVNRLSLGAQSFDDRKLLTLGRVHDSGDVRAAVAAARRAGFDNLNIDLMFALPGQDEKAALADLDAALDLEPEHLSWYQLTLEPNTVFFARPPDGLPDEDESADMHDAGLARLAAAGFERYEISAFSRPGRECRHNLNYWQYGDYLGTGAGAHGKITRSAGDVVRTVRTANPTGYMKGIEVNPAVQTERLAREDRVFEFMLNAFRLTKGFDEATFAARTGCDIDVAAGRLERLREQGLIDVASTPDNVRWAPTEHGFRFVNELQAEFLPDSEIGGGEPRGVGFQPAAAADGETFIHNARRSSS